MQNKYSKMNLDATDIQILEILQKNGRITNLKLAEKVGLSPPTMLERVRKLEESGIIKKYVALVDQNKIGLTMTSFVLISLGYHSRKSIEDFQKQILDLSEVVECHHVSGEGDYLLKVVTDNIGNYKDFLISRITLMEGIQKVHTMVVLDTIKCETGFGLNNP